MSNVVVIEKLGRYMCELYFLPEDKLAARELNNAIKQMRIIRCFPGKERGRDFTPFVKKATLLEERLMSLFWDFRSGKNPKLGIRNMFPVLLSRQLSFELLQVLSTMGLTSFDEIRPAEADIFTVPNLRRHVTL